MNYIKQLAIILLFTYVAEVAVNILNIPFPGSILGMLLLFGALKWKLVSIDAVKDSGNYLLQVLPIMFVPLGVGIMEYADVLRDSALAVAVIIVVTTLAVLVSTGWVVQLIKKRAGDYHAL